MLLPGTLIFFIESLEIKVWALRIVIVKQLRNQSLGTHLCTNTCIGTNRSLWIYFEDVGLYWQLWCTAIPTGFFGIEASIFFLVTVLSGSFRDKFVSFWVKSFRSQVAIPVFGLKFEILRAALWVPFPSLGCVLLFLLVSVFVLPSTRITEHFYSYYFI